MKNIDKNKTLGENNMDDFILEIKSGIEKDNGMNIVSKPSKFRELMILILSSKPDIKITDACTEEGDIRFEVSLKSLGFTPDSIKKYRAEVSTEFAANFMGEILVRENIDKFIKILLSLKDKYILTVNKYEHRKFGMIIAKDKCVFAFHASLIQTILTEDVKKELK